MHKFQEVIVITLIYINFIVSLRIPFDLLNSLFYEDKFQFQKENR
jgi:hypothetical protein